MSEIASVISAAKPPRDLFPWKGHNGLNAMLNARGDAFLFHISWSSIHLVDGDGLGGYTVMDDSDREISRHLHALKHAKGRVLKTGLGLGCFVRMCLGKPDVEHIDVVEIDQEVINHFGVEFQGNPRVTIHHADAFDFPLTEGPWDFAWHDIYCDSNEGLTELHIQLIARYAPAARKQGAWQLERWIRRRLGPRVI